MFAKCLKHEMKATARVLLPLLICMVAVSIAATLSLGGLLSLESAYMGGITDSGEIEMAPSQNGGTLYSILDALTTLLVIAFFVVLIIAVVSVFVLMVRRFYTSFFTDEGYLTFTLPVTVDCHILTKAVSMIIWNVASYAAMGASILIFVLGIFWSIPEAFEIDEYTKLYINQALDRFGDIFGSTVVFGILQMIASNIASFMLLYFSISVGCMLTKKHRFIVCAACVFVISGVVSEIMAIATELLSVPFQNMGYSEENVKLLAMAVMLISTVLYIVQGVGCYFGTRWILKNKINLE